MHHSLIRILNSTDGSEKQTLQSNIAVSSLYLLHNGNLISCGSGGKIEIWNSKTYKLEKTLERHSKAFSVICFAVFPNTGFASGSYNGDIIIWGSSGEYKMTLGFDMYPPVLSLAVFPSGLSLASAYDDGMVRIWNVEDGSLKHNLDAHEYDVRTVLVMLYNGLLVSGSSDNKMKFVNENGRVVYAHSYNSSVTSLAVLANQDLLVGLGDGRVLIKDKDQLESQESMTIQCGHSVVNLVAFSNGDFLTNSYEYDIENDYYEYFIKVWSNQNDF